MLKKSQDPPNPIPHCKIAPKMKKKKTLPNSNKGIPTQIPIKYTISLITNNNKNNNNKRSQKKKQEKLDKTGTSA